MTISWTFFINSDESTVLLNHSGGVAVFDVEYFRAASHTLTLSHGVAPSENELGDLMLDLDLYEYSKFTKTIKPRFKF